MRLGIWLIFLFAAALSPVASAGSVSAGEFPFEFREGFIWVRVVVPQSGEPLNFLLDSGAGVSVINLQTAKRLGLGLGNRVSVEGVGSGSTGFWPERLSAGAGGVRLPSDYLAVDLGDLSGSCECRVDGLIGADFFRGRIVQIDFGARKVRLLGANTASTDQEVLPLRARRGALLVPVAVNHGAARWVRLDTGCASNLQWVTDHQRLESQSSRVAIALTKVSISVAQASVRLGAARFETATIDLHQEPIFAGEAGLLGNGLLSRFGSVTIDTTSRRVFLGNGPTGLAAGR